MSLANELNPGLFSASMLPAAGADANIAVLENRLASARLGIASSLFFAMRAKHPPLGAHGLRVAISCSAWATMRRMSDGQRDRLEIAALLHDVGVIGLPDRILRKPGPLTTEERLLVGLQGNLGAEILRGCCDDETLLETIRLYRNWYLPQRSNACAGEDLPLEARMLAIAEAFESMTCDQPFRPAMPHAEAVEELQRCAGTQFDPKLVEEYGLLLEASPTGLHGTMVSRWLHELRQDVSDRMWERRQQLDGPCSLDVRLYRQVVEKSLDPTIIVNQDGIVIGWNAALQQSTGISAEAAIGSRFTPATIGLCDENGTVWPEDACPIGATLRSSVDRNWTVFHRMNGNQHRRTKLHVWSIQEVSHGVQGAVAVFRSESATDNLSPTPIASDLVPEKKLRAVIEDASSLAAQNSFPVLVITGFESLPQQLVELCRQRGRNHDVLGVTQQKQLIMLWPGCELSVARQRAEQIEAAWLPLRNVYAMQASNVKLHLTSVQVGDTFASLLDRAQNSPLHSDTKVPGSAALLDWLDGAPDSDAPIKAVMVTSVAPFVTFEKLRGFIADQQATVVDVTEDTVKLRMAAAYMSDGRRRSERRVEFELTITMQKLEGRNGGTEVVVDFKTVKPKDRRIAELRQCARELANALRSYLMAELTSNV